MKFKSLVQSSKGLVIKKLDTIQILQHTFLLYRLIFKVAVVFTFGLLTYQCLYRESTWQLFVDPASVLANGEVTESEG